MVGADTSTFPDPIVKPAEFIKNALRLFSTTVAKPIESLVIFAPVNPLLAEPTFFALYAAVPVANIIPFSSRAILLAALLLAL